jgi:hypothetical protein
MQVLILLYGNKSVVPKSNKLLYSVTRGTLDALQNTNLPLCGEPSDTGLDQETGMLTYSEDGDPGTL